MSTIPPLLVEVARRVFGTQLPKRAMTRLAPGPARALAAAARDDTLSRFTNITQTALGKAYVDQRYATRASQIAFLQARKKTKNFLENLRDAFHREHRASWLIPKAGAGEEARGVYELRGAGGDPLYVPYPHTLDAQRDARRAQARGSGPRPRRPAHRRREDGRRRRLAAAAPPARSGAAGAAGSPTRSRCSTSRPSGSSVPPTRCRPASSARCGSSPATASRPACSTAAARTSPARRSRRSPASSTGAAAGAPRSRTSSQGPTVVIVDEAHHVASRSYQTLLDLVRDEEIHDVVGPHGHAVGPGRAPGPDRRRVPAAGDLAHPRGADRRGRARRLHASSPVRTGPADRGDDRRNASRPSASGDLPMTVLRKLETGERNAVVLRTYQSRAETWGRTLLFTTTIENADALAAQFTAAGIDARALHSQSEATLSDLRPWFKEHPHAVLISVGMLLEGVDLPEARTALIARATTSPNVLSQMVGRVLRGVAAGGEATANVVYLQDDWDDFTAVLSPTGPWEGGDSAPLPGGPPDVAAAVAAALRAAMDARSSDAPAPDVQIALEQRQIVGAYELADATVPVFDHQYEFLRDHLQHGGPFRWPEDAPPPPVAAAHLERLEQHVARARAAAAVSPGRPQPRADRRRPHALRRHAADVRRAPGGDRRRLRRSPLAQLVYPTLRHFAEAVEHWQHALARPRPDAPLPDSPPGRPPLPRRPERSLEPTLDLVMRRARGAAPGHAPAAARPPAGPLDEPRHEVLPGPVAARRHAERPPDLDQRAAADRRVDRLRGAARLPALARGRPQRHPRPGPRRRVRVPGDCCGRTPSRSTATSTRSCASGRPTLRTTKRRRAARRRPFD